MEYIFFIFFWYTLYIGLDDYCAHCENIMHKAIKFCQRVSNSCFFLFIFLVDEGEMFQAPLKAGHHGPASETPFEWRFACRPMMV